MHLVTVSHVLCACSVIGYALSHSELCVCVCVCVLVYAVPSGPVSGCGVLCLGVCLSVFIRAHLREVISVVMVNSCSSVLSEGAVCIHWGGRCREAPLSKAHYIRL